MPPFNDPLADAVNSALPKKSKRTAGLTPELETYIRSSADEIGVPHDVALRQLNTESGFKSSATSPKGARGVAQFMPATAKRFGVDVNDPYSSVDGWKKYMGFLLKRFGGRMDLALAGYNAGEGAVDKFGGIPPYQETQDYVRKIMGGQQSAQQGKGKKNLDPLQAAVELALPKSQSQKKSVPWWERGKSQSVDSGILPPLPRSPFSASGTGEANYGIAKPSSVPEPAGVGHGKVQPGSLEDRLGSAYIGAIQYGGQNITEGVIGGTSGALRKLATAAASNYAGDTFTQLGVPQKLRGAAKFLDTGVAEMQQEHIPTGFFDTVGQTVLQGAGRTAVDLPQLMAGGRVLGAFNLPVQMAAERGEEGYTGMARGAVEGTIYHFGMGLTAPLGKVRNFLVWGAGSTAQSAIEQKIQTGHVNMGQAVGGGLTMGALSAMGERVKVRDPKTNEVRFAAPRDLIGIQRGKIEVLPPSYLEPYINAFKNETGDVLISQKVKDAQQRINDLQQRRESVMRMTRPLADQAVEQLQGQVDPYQFKVLDSHLQKLSDEDRLWQVISIQNQLARGIRPENLKLEYQPQQEKITNDQENKTGLPSQVGVGKQEPFETQLDQGTGQTEIKRSGILQTQEGQINPDLSIKERPMENGRYVPESDDLNREALPYTAPVEDRVKDMMGASGLIPPHIDRALQNAQVTGIIKDLGGTPELSHLSPHGLAQIAVQTNDGLQALGNSVGPKIKGTDIRVSSPDWEYTNSELEHVAESPGMQRLAGIVSNVFDKIKLDLNEPDIVLGGFNLSQSHYGINWGRGWFKDGKGRIYVDAHKSLAAINALHELGYIEPEEFSDALAQHITETIYHEFAHQSDPISFKAKPPVAEDIGVEGHDKEFDIRYQKLVESQADNVIKYKDEIRRELLKNNEQITNEIGQQALNFGELSRFNADFNDKDLSRLAERGKLSAGAVLAGSGRPTGAGFSENAPGRFEDQSDRLYPLYKKQTRDKLIRWAGKRKENLDRFMGENSIFRKRDGDYFPAYHGSTADFEQFKQRTVGQDIGFHFSETPEGAADRLRQKYNPRTEMPAISVKGEGYERQASRREVLEGKKLLKGEQFQLQDKTKILPVYLRLENPIEIADFDQTASPKRLAQDLIQQEVITPEEAKSATSMPQLKELLQSKGYDGIQYDNKYEDPGSKGYIVFEPEQIKSAIGNAGEFDPHDPNIMRSMDPVTMAVKGAIETGKLLYRGGTKFVDWSREMIKTYGPGIKLHLQNIWEAVVQMHQDERGFVTFGASKFYAQDIEPKVKSAAIALNQGWDTILKHFAPAARSLDAKDMAGLIREEGSLLWQKFFRAEHALREARSILDKIPQDQTYNFINKIENGQPQTIKELQPLADVMRRMLDEARATVQNLGTGKLNSFYVDYFPHLWEDPVKARQTFQSLLSGKRPLAGPKSFLRRRTHLTFQDGLDAGLVPLYTNPVDMVLHKMHEVNKYVMAQRVMQEAKGTGLVRYVKAGKIEQMKLKGYAEINDSIATVYGGGAAKPQGGLLIRGKYMAPEQAARVLNNYLSPGLRQNAAFRGYMFLANSLNQFQLGWSAFHAGFTTIDAMTSKLSLGVEYMAAGKPVKAIGQLIRANPITAPIENLYRGNKVLLESMRPGSTNAYYAEIVKNLTAGGFRPKMEKIYTNDMVSKLTHAWKQGNYIGAVLRAPFALTEAVAKPILEELVPRQKLGVAADLVRLELDKNPNMSVQQRRAVMGKAWDSVDNRLGQMTYDNLFWNRTAKDLAMFSVRSVGWNLGTFREIGGGIYDTVTAPAELYKRMTSGAKGRDLMTHRMAYTMVALPMYTALLGAITQYLYTGKGPQELKDYFFPRTGNFDERGNPERVNLPTYVKDIYHYRDAYKLGPHTRKTLIAKLHPMLSTLGNMMENEDYFGTEIHAQDDPFLQRRVDDLKYLGKSSLPFGVQNYMKERERGASVGKSLIPILTGITPAPSDINQTPAEEELYNYNQSTRPQGTRTKEEAARTQIMFQIRSAILKKDNPRAVQLTKQGLNDGIITQNDISQVVEDLQKSPLQKRFSATTPEEAYRAWKLMSDSEKMDVQELMKNKLQRTLELPPARRDKIMGNYKDVIQYYTSKGQPK